MLLAHPNLAKSRANRAVWERAKLVAASDPGGYTLVDLYDEYPYFDIDVHREQERLESHDEIVFQHPIYWYSMPPLLKLWTDEVLELGFAYGEGGTRLEGKGFQLSVTVGGSEDAYRPEGSNRFTLEQLLAPQEQTARLCGMRWHKPIRFHSSQRPDGDFRAHAENVAAHLKKLREGP